MILVTGGTGFIGQAVVQELLSAGLKVRLLVRDTEKAKSLFPAAEIVKGDILDGDLSAAFRGVTELIHLAGLISYTLPKEELFRVNVEGTKNLLSFADNVNKIVFASSVAVYGESTKRLTETDPLQPQTPYGESKLAAEKVVLESGIPAVALRLSVVYGPASPIWNEIMRFYSKGFPLPHTKNLTDLVHVSDVARAFQLALTKGDGAYNIAGGTPIPFKELASLCSSTLGVRLRFWPAWLVKLLARLKGKGREMNMFIKNRDYDSKKAQKELGWQPQVKLDAGVKEMVEAYLRRASKTAV